MGKGRKHGSSDGHDRLLGTYSCNNGHVASTDGPDFGEDDVWPVSSSGHASIDSWTSSESDGVISDRSSGSKLWARKDHRQVGGLSLAFEDRYTLGPPTVIHQHRNVDSPGNRHVEAATSAPVSVPGWSKMVRVDSTDSLNGSVELDRDESEWVPPHEYLAREHGKTVTTSVFEGVGRTLKGRDMSRVRDAVWSQTGFFG